MDNAASVVVEHDVDGHVAVEQGSRPYHDLTRMIERMHRRFLDVLRAELASLDISDINAVQCLLLSNIGDEEINVRNLMEKGYYQGSNASYNIKKLVEMGYLRQERSPHDRRSTNLRLSDKGLRLCHRIREAEERVANKIAGQNIELGNAIETLLHVERVWAEHMRYGG